MNDMLAVSFKQNAVSYSLKNGFRGQCPYQEWTLKIYRNQ